MADVIEHFKGSIIHHGKYNNRVYLMKLAAPDSKEVISKVLSITEKNNYGKIVAKIPETAKSEFLERGFEVEGKIVNFYNGLSDAVFVSHFRDKALLYESNAYVCNEVLENSRKKKIITKIMPLKDNFTLRRCKTDDLKGMADVYRRVFSTYPFPIHEPEYLKKTMDDSVIYYGIFDGDTIAVLSSAEIDFNYENAEMTDFATLPEYRGHGFANHLLDKMHSEAKKIGLKTLYTIARSVSHGMNITFARLGYKFGGRLRNNTNISGNIESMNIWYRGLVS